MQEMMAIYKPWRWDKGVYLIYNNGKLNISIEGEYTQPIEEEFMLEDKLNSEVAKFLAGRLNKKELISVQHTVRELYDTL